MSSTRRPDPQVVLQGRFKKGARTDYITFRLEILKFELVFIVTVPEEHQSYSPVYVKFRIKDGSNNGYAENPESLHEDEL